MKLWIDAQLPPACAVWIADETGVETCHVRGTRVAGLSDHEIFRSLRNPGDVIVTKDDDFATIVVRFRPPPQVLWIRLGNASNRALRARLLPALPKALSLLRSGETLVEIG
jgi:predicted nuclease of predicted toxin-antitoxin system